MPFDPFNFGGVGNPYSPPAPAAPGLIDPRTGRPIDLAGLREGAAAGTATVAHGFALDPREDDDHRVSVVVVSHTDPA